MDLEFLIGNKDRIKENFITTFLKEISKSMEEKYIVDRFEENFAVCEKQSNNEMINIPKEDLPEQIQEGMTIKKENGEFKIDSLNCSVCMKKALDELKNNWNIEDLYVVNSILSNAVKCTSLNKSENIYIKDEELISKLDKGTILKKESESEFIIDNLKTNELKEKLVNMKF